MIDFDNNKSFCPYLFKAGMIHCTDQEVSVPCCRYDKNKHHVSNTQSSIHYQTNIHDYKQSYYQDIRQASLLGEAIPGCWRCYHDENIRGTSMRLNSINEFKKYDYKNWKKQFFYGPVGDIDSIHIPELTYLEIESGRFCNLKCRSCSPNLSTTWDEDSEVYFGPEHHNMTDFLKNQPNVNHEIDKLTKQECANLTEIKITGGEPFLTDTVTSFLTKLCDWGLAENIAIEVFTNCSFFPKQTYRKILPKFRLVNICLSLDAIDEKAEFIRKKCTWNVVDKVASYWSDFCAENKTIKPTISHTVSIFNAMYFDEFVKWVEQKFYKHIQSDYFDDNIIGYHFALTPEYLCLSNFSTDTKTKILSHIESIDRATFISKYSQTVYERYIKDVKKICTSSDTDKTQEFAQKTDMLDRARSEQWRRIFPELAEILQI